MSNTQQNIKRTKQELDSLENKAQQQSRHLTRAIRNEHNINTCFNEVARTWEQIKTKRTTLESLYNTLESGQ